MLERLLIAGSGGQGIILLGKMVGFSAIDQVEHVTFFPAYGAEVRGGTSNCRVIMSSQEIASPVSTVFDSIIIMNQASADKFMTQLDSSGVAIVNSSLCDISGPSVVAVDALRIADRIGSLRVANFVMMGAYVAQKAICPVEVVESTIAKVLRGKDQNLIDLNIKAFHAGLES